MADNKLVFVVEWWAPDDAWVGGIAGVFDKREDAKRLVDRFKVNHAIIKECPLNFGDVPQREKDDAKDYEDYMERGERQRLP